MHSTSRQAVSGGAVTGMVTPAVGHGPFDGRQRDWPETPGTAARARGSHRRPSRRIGEPRVLQHAEIPPDSAAAATKLVGRVVDSDAGWAFDELQETPLARKLVAAGHETSRPLIVGGGGKGVNAPSAAGVVDRGDSCEGGACTLRPVPLHGDASWDRAGTRLGRDVQVRSHGGMQSGQGHCGSSHGGGRGGQPSASTEKGRTDHEEAEQ